ncbi:hypothetical protein KC19_1G011700 [Ceratodon purpureus]|uniref:Uncharacterized protein n=1 Tax=Ceratodon purpureus TaxID=3225 RepID=A0A8T0J2X1_CERPU|nr:hypothetical protein KC19_1G011700 [Ceratodon purpureus]
MSGDRTAMGLTTAPIGRARRERGARQQWEGWGERKNRHVARKGEEGRGREGLGGAGSGAGGSRARDGCEVERAGPRRHQGRDLNSALSSPLLGLLSRPEQGQGSSRSRGGDPRAPARHSHPTPPHPTQLHSTPLQCLPCLRRGGASPFCPRRGSPGPAAALAHSLSPGTHSVHLRLG